jgi:hypothetical protein
VVVCVEEVPDSETEVVCSDTASKSCSGNDLHEMHINVNNAINVNKESNFFIIRTLLWETGIISSHAAIVLSCVPFYKLNKCTKACWLIINI